MSEPQQASSDPVVFRHVLNRVQTKCFVDTQHDTQMPEKPLWSTRQTRGLHAPQDSLDSVERSWGPLILSIF